MTDLKDRIWTLMKDYTLASLATITKSGKPWSRYVVVRADQDFTIWSATFKNSRKVDQISSNPEVHLNLGVSDPKQAVAWLQVQGRAEILEDARTKQAVWYDMLEPIFSGPDDPLYVVCKVVPYRIEYYTMNKKQPEVWEK